MLYKDSKAVECLAIMTLNATEGSNDRLTSTFSHLSTLISYLLIRPSTPDQLFNIAYVFFLVKDNI
jgi:hypothetical protein